MLSPETKNIVDFVVMGEPRPWTIFTKQGRPPIGFLEMQTWQELIRIEAKRAMKGRESFTGPIYLKILFCREIPERAPKNPDARERWCINSLQMRPDLTNYLKACEDAMTQLVYLDDNQVVRTEVAKEYGDHAHTQIVVQTPEG